MDCTSSVSYCVNVVGNCLVSIIVCWNVRTPWSSLYASHCAIPSYLCVTVMPLSFIAYQPVGGLLMMSVYCVSVQVSRISDKRAIVWGCGVNIVYPEECWRLRLMGTRSPSGAGGCSEHFQETRGSIRCKTLK
jgi:hypothetical protein